MRRDNQSLPSLKKSRKQIYPQSQLKQTQRQFVQRFTQNGISQSIKLPRPFIHFSKGLPNELNDIGFQSFSTINAQNKNQIIESLKQFKNRQSWLKLSLKAEIAFNHKQYNKINEYCKSTHLQQRQLMIERLKKLQPPPIKQKIKTIQKYKSAIKQTTGIQIRLKKSLFDNNKLCWKPYIDYDSIPVGLGQKVYFFGGRKQSSIGSYNVRKDLWSEQFKPSKMKPFGQTQGSVISNSQVIFFGGVRFGQIGFTTPINWIQRINVQKFHQEIYQYDVNIVPPRYYHAQCIYGQFLIISGGLDVKDKMFNNFMTYHIQKNYWNELPIAKKPTILQQGFAKHRMIPVFYKRKFYNLFDSCDPIDKNSDDPVMHQGIYMFGGQDSQANLLNKVYLIKIGKPSIVIEQLSIKGIPPKQRKNFALCKFKSYIIIHGGRNDQLTPYIMQSIHCLNLINLNWIGVHSDKNFRRYSHVFSQYSDNQFVIMGGISTEGVCKDVYAYQFNQITDYL